jgi:hypothetical protein
MRKKPTHDSFPLIQSDNFKFSPPQFPFLRGHGKAAEAQFD